MGGRRQVSYIYIHIYCLKFKVIALAADKGNAPKVEIMRDNFVCIQNE